jgi:Uma2 family endonuclease
MPQTVTAPSPPLTLAEFLQLPAGDITYEYQDGQAIAKMSPKRIHSCVQRVLLFLLSDWGNEDETMLPGDAYPEWAICLKRHGVDWCPVPDITYISDAKLEGLTLGNDACPVPPELVVEILSPGQSFEAMTLKALDYLAAGVQRVWLVSDRNRSLTIFAPDSPPFTYQGDQGVQDDLFPGLSFTMAEVFAKAKI